MTGSEPAWNAMRLGFEAGRAGPGASVFRCALCGCRFTHAGLACRSCPLKAGCDVVACPHCGFQFPRTSRSVEWARRLLRLFRGRVPAPPQEAPRAEAGPAKGASGARPGTGSRA